ncbi:hypothetical protein [Virgibacillus pantothenticus]|uniref:hypothetical protein n=1 Tax=Virgibacillus pantothenticus TaxID=1473 RepID=UPI0009860078|nr:hypothetical protein [Virgibacillus pantothenticus]
MQKWKQAWQIAKFELSVSVKRFVFGSIPVVFFASLLIISFHDYLNSSFILYDVFFIIFFTGGLYYRYPDHLQSRQQWNFVPWLKMQLPLPIQQEILIKSRFIIHFCFSFPVQIAFLIIFYVASPIANLLSIPAYISFAIIWLSVNFYLGTSVPISEVYQTNRMVTVAIIIVMLFIFLFILSGSHLITDHGVVELSIIVAKKWPLTASGISLIIGLAAVKAHQVYMKKFLNQLDYL